jgi:hypothetical protein
MMIRAFQLYVASLANLYSRPVQTWDNRLAALDAMLRYGELALPRPATGTATYRPRIYPN